MRPPRRETRELAPVFKRLENETRRLATTAWRVRLGGGPAAAEAGGIRHGMSTRRLTHRLADVFHLRLAADRRRGSPFPPTHLCCSPRFRLRHCLWRSSRGASWISVRAANRSTPSSKPSFAATKPPAASEGPARQTGREARRAAERDGGKGLELGLSWSDKPSRQLRA